MDNLTIDRERGLYRFQHKGKVYCFPSVTAVLRRFFPPHISEEARWKGKYVHAATCLLDGGGDGSGLHWPSVPLQAKGCLEAWERFKKENLAVVVGNWIERPVCSFRYGFAGTSDRLMALIGGWTFLIDLKTGAKEDWHALQTAAYVQGVRECGRPYSHSKIRRMSVYLRDNGGYSAEEWTDPGDLPAFLGMLTAANWMGNRGTPHEQAPAA